MSYYEFHDWVGKANFAEEQATDSRKWALEWGERKRAAERHLIVR